MRQFGNKRVLKYNNKPNYIICSFACSITEPNTFRTILAPIGVE